MRRAKAGAGWTARVLLCAGCTGAPEPAGPRGWADYRVEVPPMDGLSMALKTPIIEVPPYTEGRVCVFDTWEGPEVGIVRAFDLFHPDLTHHIAVLDVDDDVYPDDEVIQCSSNTPGSMVPYGLLFEGTGPEPPGSDYDAPGPDWEVRWFDADVARVSMVVLPEGIAFRMPSGQRLGIDFHFFNVFDQPVRTNAAFNLELVPADEVEAWAGVAMLDSAPFALPPGPSTVSFDCEIPADVTVIDIQGHMHERGASFKLEALRVDGEVEPLYVVDDWLPGMATASASLAIAPGDLVLRAGDVLRTTCVYDNPTGETLEYPTEMCTSTFVGYPMAEGLVCFNGVQEGPPGGP